MNSSTLSRNQILIGLGLAALMAATRGQQFAPLGQHLPDATLAVFFLAGFYLRSGWGFAAMFGLATVIDLVAVGWGGVSGVCLTSAYAFLIPAYGAVWAAGRWYAGRHRDVASTLPLLAGVLVAGGLVSELFASGGFYWFSGLFAAPAVSEFAGRLVAYLPQTLLGLIAYVGIAGIAHLGIKRALGAGSQGIAAR